jgi:hypothetical protein
MGCWDLQSVHIYIAPCILARSIGISMRMFYIIQHGILAWLVRCFAYVLRAYCGASIRI